MGKMSRRVFQIGRTMGKMIKNVFFEGFFGDQKKQKSRPPDCKSVIELNEDPLTQKNMCHIPPIYAAGGGLRGPKKLTM